MAMLNNQRVQGVVILGYLPLLYIDRIFKRYVGEALF